MKLASAILVASLSSSAAAEMPATQRFETMWSTYNEFCQFIVAEPENLFSNLGVIAQNLAIYVNSTEGGDVYELKIVSPEMSFDIHAGFVGDKTLMSCGVSAKFSDTNGAGFANVINNRLVTELPRESVRGGKTPKVEIYHTDGAYGSWETEENYQFFVSNHMPDVDTLTFIQVLDGWISIYFHHVFEGRVGFPTAPITPIRQIP